MSYTKTLIKKVYIEPEYLDNNLLSIIKNKIENFYINKCSKEDGYILKLLKINNIKDNYIMADCDVFDNRIVSTCNTIFIVSFDVEVIKPEIDKEYECIVFNIISAGIIVIIKDKIKVLITSPIDGYIFNINTKSFDNKDKIIKIGDIIKVKIKGTKYSNKNYNSFGILV